MSLRAVLFDVGGPIDTEVLAERLIDRDIREALVREGVIATARAFQQAERWAIDSFAPNLYQAVIWRLTGLDATRARRVWRLVDDLGETRDRERGGIELRPGIPRLLRDLSSAGLTLGLVANQPARAITRLAEVGLLRWFNHRDVSGTTGLRKPDVRVFLAASAALDVTPASCIMVGDRIDVDVAPAKLLGMTTIRLRVGRHASQEPRSWLEVPDAEVFDVEGLRSTLRALSRRGA